MNTITVGLRLRDITVIIIYAAVNLIQYRIISVAMGKPKLRGANPDTNTTDTTTDTNTNTSRRIDGTPTTLRNRTRNQNQKHSRSRGESWNLNWWVWAAAAATAFVAVGVYSFFWSLQSLQTLQAVQSEPDITENATLHNHTQMSMARSKSPPPIMNELYRPRQLNDSDLVAVKEWRVGKRFLRDIIAQGKPTIIKHAPITGWHLYNLDLLALAKLSSAQKPASELADLTNTTNATKAKRRRKNKQLSGASQEVDTETLLTLNGTRYQAKDPLFILNSERDKGGMLGSAHDRPLIHTDLSLYEFLMSTFDPATFLYWTGQLSSFERAYLAVNETSQAESDSASQNGTQSHYDSALASGWNMLTVVDPALEGSISYDDATLWDPSLWLSHPGVCSQLHYDTQHNFYVQLQGLKKFVLFTPKQEICPYPNIHRSYRQSQVIFERSLCPAADQHVTDEDWNSERLQCNYVDSTVCSGLHLPLQDGRVSYLEPVEFILQPGDVLYIPPFHSHRVEALTLSLSASVLSPSAVEAAVSEIFFEKVPFGAFQGKTSDFVTWSSGLLTNTVNRCRGRESLSSRCESVFNNATAKFGQHGRFTSRNNAGWYICAQLRQVSLQFEI
jgi:hypothetical protein